MIYLDAAATAPVRREVMEAMWPYFAAEFGNPASHHQFGESAAAAVKQARVQVASILGARQSEIIFTSGGTESDNTALKGIALANPRGRHVLVSAIEHSAVLGSAAWLSRMGFVVEHLPVDRSGLVDAATLRRAIRDDTTLVSVQLANNEIGTIQPIAELSAVAAECGVPFHSDAVQAASWCDLDVTRLGVQALSLSGHKLGAPKGIGVLYVSRGIGVEPLIHGGDQQNGRRSGTEPVALAVGMAAALQLARDELPASSQVVERRDVFIEQVLGSVAGAQLTGHRQRRLAGNASFVFPGRSGESILLDLERHGIICSSGSACASGSDEPSHVLTAMGFRSEVAQTAVRFSFGHSVTATQLATTAETLSHQSTH